MEWGWIVLLVLAAPFVIVWPALIWGGVIVRLYKLVSERARRKATANQKHNTETA